MLLIECGLCLPELIYCIGPKKKNPVRVQDETVFAACINRPKQAKLTVRLMDRCQASSVAWK